MRLNPNAMVAVKRVGESKWTGVPIDQAIAEYPEAVGHNFRVRGDALKDQGKLGEAVAAYRVAIGAAPNLAAAYSGLVLR